MIESLKGMHETVKYKENTNLRLYDNTDNEEYPAHWHGSLEIVMPIHSEYSGSCCGQEFSLREGDVLIICPGTVHQLYAIAGERLIFQVEFSILRPISSLESVISMISPMYILTPEQYPEIHLQIKKILLEIMDIYKEDALMSEAMIYSKLVEMFVLIGRNHTTNTASFAPGAAKQKEYSEKFLRICDYIRTHCAEEITLEGTASAAGFSKFYFSRLFQQFTGTTFYKYVNQNRIMMAKKYLLEPNITITEVALRSGFSSISAFNRMFRQTTGYTPTQFQEMSAHYKNGS